MNELLLLIWLTCAYPHDPSPCSKTINVQQFTKQDALMRFIEKENIVWPTGKTDALVYVIPKGILKGNIYEIERIDKTESYYKIYPRKKQSPKGGPK